MLWINLCNQGACATKICVIRGICERFFYRGERLFFIPARGDFYEGVSTGEGALSVEVGIEARIKGRPGTGKRFRAFVMGDVRRGEEAAST